jgi:hypothetical protein
MKIVICGSIDFKKEMHEYKAELERMGHEVLLPEGAYSPMSKFEFDKLKKTNPQYFRERRQYYMRKHFEKVADSATDAILVLNFPKNNIYGYIGPNTLFEIAIAFYFGKRIYLLHKVSETEPYSTEIFAINPTILDGDIKKLV